MNAVSFAVSPQLYLLAFAISAGLCLRQVGLSRSDFALREDLHSFAVFVGGCVAFWLVGSGLLASVNDPGALLHGVIGTLGGEKSGRSLLFDLAVAAIAGQVVAGALAERIKLLALMLFAIVFTGLVFPIGASWLWGGGWLAGKGFVDFGGATLVHSAAGWAALAGLIVLGGRKGRFDPTFELDGKEHHSHLLAVIGTVLVLAGWQGAMLGLRAALPPGLPVPDVSVLLTNVNLSALAGGVVALAVGYFVDRPRIVPISLNGVVAGLVAISADPLQASVPLALVIGAVAGALAALVPQLIEKLRFDDVTDAVSAHLAAGIWGTLAVAITSPIANIGTQLLGIAAVGAFAFGSSFLLFFVLQLLLGLRVRPAVERPSAA